LAKNSRFSLQAAGPASPYEITRTGRAVASSVSGGQRLADELQSSPIQPELEVPEKLPA
jgi:hypothetical protein